MGFQVGDRVQGRLSRRKATVIAVGTGDRMTIRGDEGQGGWVNPVSQEGFELIPKPIEVRMTFEIGDHTRRTDGVNDKIYKVVGISTNRKYLWLEPGVGGNGVPGTAPADVHERVVEKTRTVTEWVKA